MARIPPRTRLMASRRAGAGSNDRHFPDNTDGASRHVKCFAEQLRYLRSPLRAVVFEPDHIARSMELTVLALWSPRSHC